MTDWFSLTALAVLPCAAVFGAMAFFAGIMAPMIFAKLPGETAGAFIRQVFPVYYLTMAALSALTAVLAITGHPVEAWIMAGVALGFVVARQYLMPWINRFRDAHLAGEVAAKPRFVRLHRLSVVLNTIQLMAVTVVLFRLAR